MSATANRSINPMQMFLTLVAVQTRRNLIARKTRALAVIQLIPVLCAVVYVLFEDVDGLSMFTRIIETVSFPYLVPIAALFFGGPAIVEEMEARTLTFLTLRPIGKGWLFLGKVVSAILVAIPVVIVPMCLLFVICLAQSADMGETVEQFLRMTATASLSTATYICVFAMFGAISSSSLLSGIIYFVLMEMLLGSLPVLELASVRYHARNLAGFTAEDRLGWFAKLVVDSPPDIKWWMSTLVLGVVLTMALVVGSYVFKEKQYHV